MVSPNLTDIVTTTLRNRAPQIADNVTNKNALMTRLKQKGGMRTIGGGREITKPLDFAENGTFQYYTGYDTLNINPSDVITSATYDWKNAVVNVSISGEEARKNSGKEAILSLIDARITNAERTMANNINDGMFSDGTGSGGKEIGGLQLLVADSPATGTVGGINRANFTFWRNQSFDATTDGGAAASATNIIGYMNTVWNLCMRGNDMPDLMPADANYYEFYEAALQSQQRFGDVRMADGGFLTLKFKTGDVILEGSSSITDDHMYFLNTDFIGFDINSEGNFITGETKSSINQDATVVPLILMANMTMSNAARQGILKD